MATNNHTQVTFANGGQIIIDRLNFPGTRVYSWVTLTHQVPGFDDGIFVASGCSSTRAEAHAEAVASLSVVRAIKTVSAETLDSDGTYTQDDQGNWHKVGA
jgi:hypothetical protein